MCVCVCVCVCVCACVCVCVCVCVCACVCMCVCVCVCVERDKVHVNRDPCAKACMDQSCRLTCAPHTIAGYLQKCRQK